MTNKTSFFLPTRKGSLRVKNKNTRPFAGIEGGLLQNKLQQLQTSRLLDEIILSTNDEECIRIAEPFLSRDSRFKIIPRPEELCLDTTNLKDLIRYVITITDAQNIVWGHVTTPIAGGADYDKGISDYYNRLTEGYDSLVSVTELKNFLLNKNAEVVNNTTSLPWPRTQDLETLYEINHVMFIAGRQVYEQQENRLGTKPVLHVMDKIKSFDVDWEEDFKIAEMIFEKVTGE